MTVVIGVDGSGRTHRLRQLAAAATRPVVWLTGLPTDVPDGCLVIVDDAHRLDPAVLRALAEAARSGTPMVVSRRPTVDRPALAELDEAVATGGVEVLGPLDLDRVATLVATVTGRAVSPEVAETIFVASSGLAAVAAALATATTTPAPALLARVQRRFAVLDRRAVATARVLALRLELTDSVLAAAAGITVDELASSLRMLHDEGMLVPQEERLIPAVVDAVLAELAAAEVRRLHDAVAGSLIAAGADPVHAATQLRLARAFTPAAGTVYRQAGERLRFTDPAAALSWFDDAADAGDPDTVLGRAEASALLGLPVDTEALPEDALVTGALAAHEGRAARSADLLLAAGEAVLAVPALIATGRLDEAKAALANGSAPVGVRRLAEGALAAGDPAAALPLLIEAADAIELAPPALVLPDTPHALGAVIAVADGDLASAEHLLTRAQVGGPVAGERHRLLLAWARMRAGRYDTALAELRRTAGTRLPGRERLLRAAIAAGIARRRGDIAGLRDAWGGVEPVLARQTVDLWQAEAVEELVVAAARLRNTRRAEVVVDLLDGVIDRLGQPAAWTVALGWLRLQVAIVTEDAESAAAQAQRLAAIPNPGERARAQCVAAERWADVLAGTVDADAVLAATEDLETGQLPWEASRLAGQAAIRTTDPSAARRLLERARELSEPDRTAADVRAEPAGLSERELTVARLVLAGSTHREIGAQLYIAPKTVEHHVARIRTKLGAGSRAELLARLREIVEG